jgi:hypothetical protein
MKSQFASDVLDQHRELWAAARRADAQGARYLEALEAGDAAEAGRTQVTYREQLLAIVEAIRVLDDMLEHGNANPLPGTRSDFGTATAAT